MRLILAAMMCAVAAAPAFAQLPAPLEAALSVSPRELRPTAFDFRLETNGEGVTVRIDRSGGAVRYRLLEPDEADLTEDEARMWAGYRDRGAGADDASGDDAANEGEDEDGDESGDENSATASVDMFSTGDLRAIVGDAARFDREEAGRLVYAFAPQAMPGSMGDGEFAAAMLAHLAGEIAVDPGRGEIAWLRLFSTGSFKPHVAARVHTFSMVQTFVHEPALAGPRLRRMDLAVSGSAAFQRFEQTMVMDVSNLVFDDAPEPSEP